MHASFDAVAAWPLDRILAANDLIDSLNEGFDEAAERARAEAARRAEKV